MQYVVLITIKVSIKVRYKYFCFSMKSEKILGGQNFDDVMGA